MILKTNKTLSVKDESEKTEFVKDESEKTDGSINLTNYQLDENNRKNVNVSSFSDLSEEHFNFLLNYECKTKANDTLAGHLKSSYYYDDWPKDFEQYVISKAINDDNLMKEATELNLIGDSFTPRINALWINKQKKYEFNPMHYHSGVFSFIIPLQIPYDLYEEDKTLHGGGIPPGRYTSRLSFVKWTYDGMVCETMNVDQSYVGKVMIFSSQLGHMVYPFYTSDDYRITVAGNIITKV